MLTYLLKRIALLTLALVFLGFVALYLFQDRLIFQSVKLAPDYAFTFDFPFEEHTIEVPGENGEVISINALWFRPDSTSKGLILYFHGNRGNLQRWGNYAPNLTQHGYDVLMIDYRGYGKSTGTSSENALYADARRVWDWAMARGPYSHTVIYGRSLGSAVASRLAGAVTTDLLILETPFDEIRGVIRPYWQPITDLLPIRSVFSNKDHLKAVRVRKVILHGTSDSVVPLSSAQRLREYLDSPDDFIIIPDGGHRNLDTFPVYHKTIQSVLGRL